MNVVLTKIFSLHDNLRTDTVFGRTEDVPQQGKSFMMVAPALEGEGTRMIQTTPVVTVKNLSNGDFLFHTQNSVYELKVVPDYKDQL